MLDYGYIGFFLLLGVAMVAGGYAVSWLLRPKRRPSAAQLMAYECGEVPVGEANRQFNIRFYLFAIIFVIFDAEILFLVPWALVFTEIGWVAYAEMIIFIAILMIGWLYAWKRGALEWM
jgi:NADH-quinone oxidoreductase subunit A